MALEADSMLQADAQYKKWLKSGGIKIYGIKEINGEWIIGKSISPNRCYSFFPLTTYILGSIGIKGTTFKWFPRAIWMLFVDMTAIVLSCFKRNVIIKSLKVIIFQIAELHRLSGHSSLSESSASGTMRYSLLTIHSLKYSRYTFGTYWVLEVVPSAGNTAVIKTVPAFIVFTFSLRYTQPSNERVHKYDTCHNQVRKNKARRFAKSDMSKWDSDLKNVRLQSSSTYSGR